MVFLRTPCSISPLKKKAMPSKKYSPPKFLIDLLNARSPSGFEEEAQAVVDRYVQPIADKYSKDVLGNRFATLNPDGKPGLMFAGHIDELGLIVKYIDNDGFVYFDTIGGHDRIMISGRRVSIMTKKGIVKGVTGIRAVHLMEQEDRKLVPIIHNMWIDIGAKNKQDALRLISIGDPATYDHGFEVLRGSLCVARAFDDKAGAYVVNEALLRLSKFKSYKPKLVAVSTAQEDIGTRGAIPAAYSVNPDFAIAVDVGHATDHPDCDNRKFGEFRLGSGPIVTRGANVNPIIYRRLIACAEKENIPYQIEADPRPTGTDGRAIQIGRKGVATAVVSIPLRYMHTPSEVVDLKDVENCVRLLVSFARTLLPGQTGQF